VVRYLAGAQRAFEFIRRNENSHLKIFSHKGHNGTQRFCCNLPL
jgi:hypothetical protein